MQDYLQQSSLECDWKNTMFVIMLFSLKQEGYTISSLKHGLNPSHKVLEYENHFLYPYHSIHTRDQSRAIQKRSQIKQKGVTINRTIDPSHFHRQEKAIICHPQGCFPHLGYPSMLKPFEGIFFNLYLLRIQGVSIKKFLSFSVLLLLRLFWFVSKDLIFITSHLVL